LPLSDLYLTHICHAPLQLKEIRTELVPQKWIFDTRVKYHLN